MGVKTKRERSRNWATIVYEESAPGNWKELLKASGEKGFISPVHNMDVNADKHGDEKFKKPHYHVLVMRENATIAPRKLFQSFGGVGAEKIDNKKAYARYLCHLDDEDKAQYDVKDVIAFGDGMNYSAFIKGDNMRKEVNKLLKERIFDYIEENNATSFRGLIMQVRKNPELEEFKEILYDSREKGVILDYLRDKRQEAEARKAEVDFRNRRKSWTIDVIKLKEQDPKQVSAFLEMRKFYKGRPEILESGEFRDFDPDFDYTSLTYPDEEEID